MWRYYVKHYLLNVSRQIEQRILNSDYPRSSQPHHGPPTVLQLNVYLGVLSEWPCRNHDQAVTVSIDNAGRTRHERDMNAANHCDEAGGILMR